MKRILIFKGGEGSGNHGHAGRPGQVGGSRERLGDLVSNLRSGAATENVPNPLVSWEQEAAMHPGDSAVATARSLIAANMNRNIDSVPYYIAYRYIHQQGYTMDDATSDVNDILEGTMPLDEARRSIARELGMADAMVPDEVVHEYATNAHYGIPDAARDISAAQAELDTKPLENIDIHGNPIGDNGAGTVTGVDDADAVWRLQHPDSPITTAQTRIRSVGYSDEQVTRGIAVLSQTLRYNEDTIPADIAGNYVRGLYTLDEAKTLILGTVRNNLASAAGVMPSSIDQEIVDLYAEGSYHSINDAVEDILHPGSDPNLAAIADTPDPMNAPALTDTNPDVGNPNIYVADDTDEFTPSNDELEPYAEQLINRDFPVIAREDRNGDAFITVNMSNGDARTLWGSLIDRDFVSSNEDHTLTLNTPYGIFEVNRGDSGNVAFHAISRAGNLSDAEWANVRTNIFDKWMYLLKQV